jgi:EAL domain-containing protein (putative c-di-GMP-specific phosphodiesterase class I)/FixJ family two-component response regulator
MSEQNINQILVIDDSVDFRNLLIKFFEKVCPKATVDIYDPADGKPLETFVWDKYDLIILDYDLGNGENGLEWLRLYKTSSSFPPTIMLTAQGNEETAVNAFRYGAQDYLRKDGLTKGSMIESINIALKKYKEETKKADTQQLSVHLYNKEKFYRSLEHIKKNDIVILAEIDKFLTLRDEIGMLSADRIADFTSEKITKYITDSAYAGVMTRIGDSSFAILIRDYKGDDKGNIICEQLCSLFDEAIYKVDGNIIDFSLSIASVYVSNDTTEAEAILKQIDIACRAARDKTGNTFIINEIVNNDGIVIDEQLVAHIQNAFNEDRVKPHYQSFVKLSSMESKLDSVEYYQVRINLIGLDDGVIDAREFMPVLINKLMQKDMDRWVINSCLQQITKNDTSDIARSGFFVLLTEESMADMMFIKWLESAFVKQGTSDLNHTLVLEISVDNFLKYQKQASFLIKTLGEKHNVLFALTHVREISTMESCLSQSKFDFIMMSPFINDDNFSDIEIENIVNAGKKHSCLSVANKIETNDALMTAMRYEFDFISGFFLQPPQENIMGTEVEVVEV